MANEPNYRKIAALQRAVLMSPYINEVTIGPTCTVYDEKQNTNNSPNHNKNIRNSPVTNISVTIKNKQQTKINESSERIVKVTTDCSTIYSKAMLKNIEKERIAKVKLEMDERNKRCKEADNKRNELHQKNLEKNIIKSRNRLLMNEKQILDNIEIDEKEYNLIKINEKKQQQKRINEKKLQIKEEEERIKTINLYRTMYENYREQFIQSYNNIFQLINNYKEKNIPTNIQIILKQYKELYETIVSMPINKNNDFKQIEKCSLDMIEFTKQFKDVWQPIIQKNEDNDNLIEKEKQNFEMEKIQRKKDEEENLKRIEQENYNKQINININNTINNNNLLTSNNELYEKYEKVIEPLVNDVQMKTFCRDIKRGIFLTTNRISSNTTNEHLKDIYSKLIGILSLEVVQINNFKISAGSHPLGKYFALITIAKRFVELGEVCHSNGFFPLASVLVSIWSKFPEIGDIFLLQLYDKCPFLNPNYIIPSPSTNNYYQLIGFNVVNDVIEDQNLYLDRMVAHTKFYAATIMTKLPNYENLHNLDNGWKVISCLLNRNNDECLYINSRLLVEFLDFTGLQLLKVYGKQFIKIVKILENFYIKKLNGLAKDKLETFIKSIKEGKLNYPLGFNKKYF